MQRTHTYTAQLQWTGNKGSGTSAYDAYGRDHIISAADKPPIPGSADPCFRGDASRYNPEESLVAALSACHMLWYLHLCAVNGVVVTGYTDAPAGEMTEHPDGSGEFTQVTLHPAVVVQTESMKEKSLALHAEAHRMCFLARSVNFPVYVKGATTV